MYLINYVSYVIALAESTTHFEITPPTNALLAKCSNTVFLTFNIRSFLSIFNENQLYIYISMYIANSICSGEAEQYGIT